MGKKGCGLAMRKIWKISSVLLTMVLLTGMAGCNVTQIPQESSRAAIESSMATKDPTTVTVDGSIPAQSTSTIPTQPTTPVTKPTEPVTQPPTPTTQPTEPTTQPTTPPATKPTQSVTQPTVPETKPTEQVTQPTVPATQPDDGPAIPNRVTVEASGLLVKNSKNAVIDYSNTKDGYVMACYAGTTDKRLKAQVKGPTTTYTYDLKPDRWVAFPLSDQNGEYKVTIYQNTTGTKYAVLVSATIDVEMEDEFAPFLRSNQYVDFDVAPKAVAKAAGLTKGITDPLKKVEKVYDFVVSTLTYDKELAATVKSGYLPELDVVLEKKKGICFDYAALMTGMLRSQGIPTKLVVGYAGEVYHAWISVWSETDGWVDGVIYFDGISWKRMDPAFASSGGSSADIMNYIGNGSNYTAKYFY